MSLIRESPVNMLRNVEPVGLPLCALFDWVPPVGLCFPPQRDKLLPRPGATLMSFLMVFSFVFETGAPAYFCCCQTSTGPLSFYFAQLSTLPYQYDKGQLIPLFFWRLL